MNVQKIQGIFRELSCMLRILTCEHALCEWPAGLTPLSHVELGLGRLGKYYSDTSLPKIML